MAEDPHPCTWVRRPYDKWDTVLLLFLIADFVTLGTHYKQGT